MLILTFSNIAKDAFTDREKESPSMSVLAEPRQQAILAVLDSGGHAVVSELARQFGVSDMTIRRDLVMLEQKGLAQRVHGGAVAVNKSRFSHRLSANSRAKAKAIAKLVDFIPRTGCIYLDGSTTMLGLIKQLKGRDLQVVTNNVETFNRLAALPGPSPLLLGGSLDTRTDNLIGPLAIRAVAALVFDAAFFSAWGLHAGLGLNEITVEDAEVKERVAKRSKFVYAAIDHSKLGLTAGGIWKHGQEKSVLATDLEPGHPDLATFKAMFGRIV